MSDGKYVEIYNGQQYRRDEAEFSRKVGENELPDYSLFNRLLVSDILNNTRIIDTEQIGSVHIKDVQRALKNPKMEWRKLLMASDELMKVSPHYYKLNNLFGNMAVFCWGLDLYGVKPNANMNTLKKSYMALAEKLEGMGFEHEFSKIMRVLPYQDIFCGVVAEDQNDFFIQQVNYRICKLYEVEDGLYNFVINLASIGEKRIEGYPGFIREAYREFAEGDGDQWYKPPSDLQICVKLNTQWVYPFPMLIGLIRDIFDLDTYKNLKLQSARTDNYKAIMVKVPIDEDAVNKPLLTPEALLPFAEMNRAVLSDDIGYLYNPGSEGQAISFKENSSTRNNVQDAVGDIYDSAGMTSEVFNSSSKGTAITYSLENNAGFVYGVYRQFERWVNRFIKKRRYNKAAYRFKYYLLDVNIFNRNDVASRYKDAVALGATVIDKWMASLGVTPSRLLGSYVTHNEVFDFYNNFKPLMTSYNSSVTGSENEPGRPTNEEKGEQLTDSGEQTRDNDSNVDR